MTLNEILAEAIYEVHYNYLTEHGKAEVVKAKSLILAWCREQVPKKKKWDKKYPNGTINAYARGHNACVDQTLKNFEAIT